MDERARRRALAAGGVVATSDLGAHPGRSARAAGLVPLQPGAWVAATQPVDATVLLAALRRSVPRGHVVIGAAALWLHGCGPQPTTVEVGVRHGTTLALRSPVRVRRLSTAVLQGSRPMHGLRVVALEAALLQAAERTPHQEVIAMLEPVLRERRTTIPRLRARLRRGVGGSAAVRRALDELVGTSLERTVRQLRAALEARGVTGLQVEVRFRNAAGASCWADLLDKATGTVIEVDGYLTHVLRDRFQADRRRDRWLLAEHGLHTIRVDAHEVMTDLPAVADELAQLLRPGRTRVAG